MEDKIVYITWEEAMKKQNPFDNVIITEVGSKLVYQFINSK